MTPSNGNITVSRAICAGNSPVTGDFPAQRPVTHSFDVFFDLRLNERLNNREAGDLRRHRVHYNVTVMKIVLYSMYCTYLSYCLSSAVDQLATGQNTACENDITFTPILSQYNGENKVMPSGHFVCRVLLQWRHIGFKALQITGHSTACLTDQLSKKYIKAPLYLSFMGESTGYRWILLTSGL